MATTLNQSSSNITVSDSVETINGSSDTITLGGGDTLGVWGGGDAINFSGTGDTITVGDTYGIFDTVSGNGAGIILDANTYVILSGSNNTVAVASGDTLNADGGGNIITAVAGTDIWLNGTGSNFDAVNANGDQFEAPTAGGYTSGISAAASTYFTVSGSNNGIGLNTGDTLNANGGGNTISAVADTDVYLQGTGGNFDAVYINNDVFGGAATAGGYSSGISAAASTYFTVSGSNNGIGLNTGDTLNANGGGNTISAVADTDVYLQGTGGNFDAVYINNDVFGGAATAGGYSSGISAAASTYFTVSGSNNGIGLNTGDTLNANGGGNTISAVADTDVYLQGTGGNFDAVYINNDVFGGAATAGGYSSGISAAASTYFTVSGSNNGIGLNTGDTLNANGGGNTISAVADTNIWLTGTVASADTVTVSGDQFGQSTIQGVNTSGVHLNANTSINVIGSNDGIGVGNAGDVLGTNGGGNTIDATADTELWLTGTGASADTVTVSGDQFGQSTIQGANTSGISLNVNTYANVIGSNNGISINSAGDQLHSIGSGNTIYAVAGTDIWLNGNSNTATFSSNSGYIDVNGTSNVVNATGDNVDIGGNSSITVNGGQDYTTVWGSNSILSESNASIQVNQGFSGINLNGSGNSITLNGGDAISIGGNGNSIYANGSGNTLTISGSDEVINVSNSTINISSGLGITVVGSGNIINQSTDTSIYASGSGNTFNLKNQCGLFITNTGSGSDTINSAGGEEIQMDNSTDATINENNPSGTYNKIGVGSNDTLQLNDETPSNGTPSSDLIVSVNSSTGVQNTTNTGDSISLSASPGVPIAQTSIYVSNSGIYWYGATPQESIPVDINGNSDRISTQQYTTTGIPYGFSVSGSSNILNGVASSSNNGTYVPSTSNPISINWKCPSGTDPVILNLAGAAVQTQGLSNSAAYFDMQNNGQQVHTGWATAGEGMLVYDPNNTNSVTDDANLVPGFSTLATLDSNHDGVLNASDDAWSVLQVWVDPTGTANFQSGDLYTLAQLGITSINLNAEQVNQDSNGNTILANSTFTYANGATGDIAGVNLMFAPAQISSQVNNLIHGLASFAPASAGQVSGSLAQYGATPTPLLAKAA